MSDDMVGRDGFDQCDGGTGLEIIDLVFDLAHNDEVLSGVLQLHVYVHFVRYLHNLSQ